MEISPMKIEDYDELYQFWIQTPGMGFNNLDDSREGIARYLKRNPTTCFLAKSGSHIVGAILSGHDGRRGYIYHTAVSPLHRNQGIGKALVDRAVSALEAEGIHKVALVAFSHNDAGNAFWERIGFTKRTDLTYRNRVIHEMVRIDT